MLGVILTLKVLDIILGLTQGGPANATQTIATDVVPTLVHPVQVRPGRRAVQHLDLHLTGVRDHLPAGHPAPGRRVGGPETTTAISARHRPGDSPTNRPANRRRTRSTARTVIAIVLLAIMLFPVYWMLNISLQATGGTLVSSFIPTNPSLDGYRLAIQDQGKNLVTSLIIAVGTVVLTLVIAAPAAYALAQFRFRWINWALLAILICQMIPGIVIANALYTIYENIGLLELHPRPDHRQLERPRSRSAILIMRSFMLGIPPSLVEAARVDGAGLVRAFLSIVVPISRNSLITVGLFTFLRPGATSCSR